MIRRTTEDEACRGKAVRARLRLVVRLGDRAGHTLLSMRLLGVPDASGKPTIWINSSHLVAVQSAMRTGERSIALEAELKIDGMPLLRIKLGEHADRTAADAAFLSFLEALQS